MRLRGAGLGPSPLPRARAPAGPLAFGHLPRLGRPSARLCPACGENPSRDAGIVLTVHGAPVYTRTIFGRPDRSPMRSVPAAAVAIARFATPGDAVARAPSPHPPRTLPYRAGTRRVPGRHPGSGRAPGLRRRASERGVGGAVGASRRQRHPDRGPHEGPPRGACGFTQPLGRSPSAATPGRTPHGACGFTQPLGRVPGAPSGQLPGRPPLSGGHPGRTRSCRAGTRAPGAPVS